MFKDKKCLTEDGVTALLKTGLVMQRLSRTSHNYNRKQVLSCGLPRFGDYHDLVLPSF